MLFLPGVAIQFKETVQNCEVCDDFNDFLAVQHKQRLMTHKFPDTLWSKVAQDIFTLGNQN